MEVKTKKLEKKNLTTNFFFDDFDYSVFYQINILIKLFNKI